jgi:hypothetical protein
VLIANCHVSENLKSGPVAAQTTTTSTDRINAHIEPRTALARSATRLKALRTCRSQDISRAWMAGMALVLKPEARSASAVSCLAAIALRELHATEIAQTDLRQPRFKS